MGLCVDSRIPGLNSIHPVSTSLLVDEEVVVEDEELRLDDNEAEVETSGREVAEGSIVAVIVDRINFDASPLISLEALDFAFRLEGLVALVRLVMTPHETRSRVRQRHSLH